MWKPRGAITLTLFLFFSIASLDMARAAGDEFADGAHRFIQTLADRAVITLAGEKLDRSEQQEKFRQLLNENFEVRLLGKWALGRHWRRATKAERADYLRLFEDFIVSTYSKRFRQYTNEKLAVASASSRSAKLAIVHSRLMRESHKPIRIDWRVAYPSGKYKIVDIIVEGISLVQTHRSEFGSVIRQNGGKVSGLITALRDKTESLNRRRN
ncbi:MAG: ABC transporter substrate-binding protein [Rhodospirillales bacterium]|jgi:phospholipid transport system substrate-binding protein|nr:toluene tolerance protein [Rhodospirillaceae bacterium]MDP6429854.1 ABC transporter substrate-binding protein [Rhodospirillales bacterium]MDP6643057.1 ABC transporter substrate-binding protein [Rhodospirillales bacterium]MDP6841021.1 ABC transporter substrate-binding protein [Rhodospirillales bacterium]|tara:strand:- start:560 stop:1195 length:636 start_codon:yes stop_codon:yes gene_type:complete